MPSDRFSLSAGAVRIPLSTFFCAVALLLTPRVGYTMAADGALITNVVSATYGGMGGPTIMYTVTYNATSNVLISCPVVALSKVAIPTIQASGSVVTFQIWVSNFSTNASAFNVVISDMLADNMTYLAASEANWTTNTTGFSYALSTNNTAWQTSGALIQPAGGQGSPYYLRWNIGQLAPGKSALITYAATVL